MSKIFIFIFRLWNSVIVRPKFWKWAQLRVRLTVDAWSYKVVLHSSRLHIVQEISILEDLNVKNNVGLKILENILAAVSVGRSQLKKLGVAGKGSIMSLDPELLSQALVRLEQCNFSASRSICNLSTTQLVALFTAIERTSNLGLKSLDLPNRDYSQVPPEILVAALVKLEHTNILDNLSSDLTTSLLDKMAGSSIVNIKILNLDLRNCSGVPPELFGEALLRIETAVLYMSGGLVPGSVDQVMSLFRRIASSEYLRLRELDLRYMNLTSHQISHHISPAIFYKAAGKLETLKFSQIDSHHDALSLY